MKIKDVVIGLIVLAVLVTGVILVKNSKKPNVATTPVASPNYQQVESKFPGLKVPANADRLNLNNVSGGEGVGEAWRTFENARLPDGQGKFDLTVMATLPSPLAGTFYQGYIDNGSSKISLGRLTLEKGGYVVNYSSAKDYSAYKKVEVMLGTQTILEGSY